jgi:hypothetical protein
LQKLLRPLQARGFEVISNGVLSRAPKGVDPRHPRVELLRRKGLALDFPPLPRGVRESPAFADWCFAQARAAAPVLRWLLAHSA